MYGPMGLGTGGLVTAIRGVGIAGPSRLDKPGVLLFGEVIPLVGCEVICVLLSGIKQNRFK